MCLRVPRLGGSAGSDRYVLPTNAAKERYFDVTCFPQYRHSDKPMLLSIIHIPAFLSELENFQHNSINLAAIIRNDGQA